jgi:hypothetical protein
MKRAPGINFGGKYGELAFFEPAQLMQRNFKRVRDFSERQPSLLTRAS